jgi:hypothetical protein
MHDDVVLNNILIKVTKFQTTKFLYLNKYLVCSVRVVGDCDLVQEFLSADVYEVMINSN